MPNVVKGSKQHRMRVVPHRPLYGWLLSLLLCIGLTATGIGGYRYGHYQGVGSQPETARARQKISRLNEENGQLLEENDRLQRQLVIAQQGEELEQQSAAELQATLSEQREEIARLQQETRHYRQVVEDGSQTTGLVVDSLELDATDNSSRYRYKLVMRQLDADGDSFLVGHVNVSVVGLQDEEPARLPLAELSNEIEQVDILLRFRYFQDIEGELTLPRSFVPQSVHIHAVSTEPVGKEINEDFSWGVALEE